MCVEAQRNPDGYDDAPAALRGAWVADALAVADAVALASNALDAAADALTLAATVAHDAARRGPHPSPWALALRDASNRLSWASRTVDGLRDTTDRHGVEALGWAKGDEAQRWDRSDG